MRRIRLILLMLYPLLILMRLVRWMRGEDPLRLTEPRGSCWVESPLARSPAQTFFVESEATAVGRVASRVLVVVARERAGRAPQSAAGDGEIPDEVYTLW